MSEIQIFDSEKNLPFGVVQNKVTLYSSLSCGDKSFACTIVTRTEAFLIYSHDLQQYPHSGA